jgi:hypothetical protein
MPRLLLVIAALALGGWSLSAAAADATQFKAAYAAAVAANREAGALKDQWTTTTAALKEAEAAAAAGQYDAAVRLARHAEALAKASIAQAKEQNAAWRAAVIH